MINKNPKVNDFFNNATVWKEEYALLRTIISDYKLTEDLKWGVPCYTFDKSNIVLIHGFKEYCAVFFIKGVLLKDPNNLLIQQTKYVQAGRQLRFKNVREIEEKKSIIKEYILEAIEIEKAGIEVIYKKNDEYIVPEEFQDKLISIAGLKAAFEALTPGRQRAYLHYFSVPKQSKTKVARIEKYIPKILNGFGLNDPEH